MKVLSVISTMCEVDLPYRRYGLYTALMWWRWHWWCCCTCGGAKDCVNMWHKWPNMLEESGGQMLLADCSRFYVDKSNCKPSGPNMLWRIVVRCCCLQCQELFTMFKMQLQCTSSKKRNETVCCIILQLFHALHFKTVITLSVWHWDISPK